MNNRRRLPKSIETAVNLMYAGAALALLNIVLTLVMSSTIKENITKRLGDSISQTEIESRFSSFNTQAIVGGIIGIGLWIAMAQFNQRGMSWARIVGTVLFVISTLALLMQLLAIPPIPLFAVTFLSWLVGLGAVVFMWKKESSAYYQAPVKAG